VIEIDGKVEEEDDPDGDLREEVFDTVMMTVPFTFLFILLHVYVPSNFPLHSLTESSILPPPFFIAQIRC
jgi:hypothetical protein